MIIIVDKEGRNLIQQMCDLSLKTGGIQNLQGVLSVLNTMKDYGEPVVATEETEPVEG